MKLKKNQITNYFILFLTSHLIIWTLIPSISNNNLPLDTIEALAWGSDLDWGFNKHPPLSAFAVEVIYKVFGNRDWAYYFLSQIFVVISFFVVWKFSEYFFQNKIYSLISVLLLEGIYFYNYTTPEFNVYVCELPFWALTVLFCWRGVKNNKTFDWLLFGFLAALGVLSHYLFFYLLIAIDIFLLYMIIKNKIDFKCLISLLSFSLAVLPHFVWVVNNNYQTFTYALKRTGLEQTHVLDHIYNPLIFLAKQIGILIPFTLMILFLISKINIKFNLKDEKFLFLSAINIIPILLIFLTSLLTGAQLKTMWVTPFYLFIGVMFLYAFKEKIILKRLNYFFSIFLFLFIFSPFSYYYISVTQTDKRTDYPGEKVSRIIQEKWNKNFINKIVLVGGNEWYGGNLSYHLKPRPKWDNILENKNNASFNDINGGFVIIGDAKLLSGICSGIYFKVENEGVCMVGKKK